MVCLDMGVRSSLVYTVCLDLSVRINTMNLLQLIFTTLAGKKFCPKHLLWWYILQWSFNYGVKTHAKFGYFMVICTILQNNKLSPVKRICVFEHSVTTSFNCACPAIQRGQGSGFLSEGSSWLTAYISEQRRFWRDCTDAQARLNLRCSHRR